MTKVWMDKEKKRRAKRTNSDTKKQGCGVELNADDKRLLN